jgi:uncharacterized protein (DUF58 family)
MDAVELIKKVRKIELKMRGMTDDLLTGSYHSAFKGRGMAFDEVRAYQPGDDVRTIEWNVTARTGEPFVKKYEEERELTVLLLVDISGSAFTASTSSGKYEIATEIAAILTISALRNQDKVGLLLFAEKPVFYLPPRTGSYHLLRIIREILQAESGSRSTNISAALSYILNLQKQRCICFILSDFLDSGFEASLRVLAGKHDVTGIHLVDHVEEIMPDIGMVQVTNPETGATDWIDTHEQSVRTKYEHLRQSETLKMEYLFKRNHADYLRLHTHEPYLASLIKFFRQHGKK